MYPYPYIVHEQNISPPSLSLLDVAAWLSVAQACRSTLLLVICLSSYSPSCSSPAPLLQTPLCDFTSQCHTQFVSHPTLTPRLAHRHLLHTSYQEGHHIPVQAQTLLPGTRCQCAASSESCSAVGSSQSKLSDMNESAICLPTSNVYQSTMYDPAHLCFQSQTPVHCLALSQSNCSCPRSRCTHIHLSMHPYMLLVSVDNSAPLSSEPSEIQALIHPSTTLLYSVTATMSHKVCFRHPIFSSRLHVCQ